jgi:hypothetical protein
MVTFLTHVTRVHVSCIFFLLCVIRVCVKVCVSVYARFVVPAHAAWVPISFRTPDMSAHIAHILCVYVKF